MKKQTKKEKPQSPPSEGGIIEYHDIGRSLGEGIIEYHDIGRSLGAIIGNYPFVAIYCVRGGWMVHTNAPSKDDVVTALSGVIDSIHDES